MKRGLRQAPCSSCERAVHFCESPGARALALASLCHLYDWVRLWGVTFSNLAHLSHCSDLINFNLANLALPTAHWKAKIHLSLILEAYWGLPFLGQPFLKPARAFVGVPTCLIMKTKNIFEVTLFSKIQQTRFEIFLEKIYRFTESNEKDIDKTSKVQRFLSTSKIKTGTVD